MKYLSLFLLAGISIPLAAENKFLLPAALESARARNPEVQAAQHAWKTALAEVRPAGTWEGPTLTLAEERDPTGMAGTKPEPMRVIGVEQMIPFPGKKTAEMHIKRHEAKSAEARYNQARLMLERDVRELYYQLHLTEQSIDLADQSVAVLKNVLASAQARLASGQASAADVFMAQTELRRMDNLAFAQRQERLKIQAELNTLFHQAVDTPLGRTEAPPLHQPPATAEKLQELARTHSPFILESQLGVKAGHSLQSRQRMAFAPDFAVMAERRTMDEGPEGRMLGVAITFPLWLQKPWGEFQAARAHVQRAQAMSESKARRVEKMVYQEWVETQTHTRLAQTYVDAILPGTQSALKVVRQQYASGKADIVRFLEAFRTWVNVNLDYHQEVYHAAEHWSELAQWVGVSPEDLYHEK